MDATAAGSPADTENTVLWVIFDIFAQIWATFVAEEPLCDLGIPFPVRRRGTQLLGALPKRSKPSFVETYKDMYSFHLVPAGAIETRRSFDGASGADIL